MKKVILTVVIVLMIEVVVCVAFLYSGAYNISTANHDKGLINRALDAGTTRSIVRHAKGIQAPPLTDPGMVQEGFRHYREMCISCHGAPGVPPGEIGKGLWPDAPDLGMAASDWTPAQLFWIAKNGIKFTAMPGWGPTHSDQKIWAMVAFLEKLPHLTPADYHELERKFTDGGDEMGPPAKPQSAEASRQGNSTAR
ncbi:MAG: cytochrome c [Pedosphaera sp.]|nr:cytochrome c [Pedosphaera sp.]